MITSSLLKTADVTATLAILYNVYIDEQVHVSPTYGHCRAMIMLHVLRRGTGSYYRKLWTVYIDEQVNVSPTYGHYRAMIMLHVLR